MTGVAAAALDWPDPSGCTNGRATWSVLGAGNTVPPILNPALVFFSCKVVTNASQVWAIVDSTYNTTILNQGPLNTLKVRLNAMAMAVCPPTDTTPSTDCADVQTKLATLNDIQPGDDATLSSLLTDVNTMIAQANALIAAQGWTR